MKDFAISVVVSTLVLSVFFIGIVYYLASRSDGFRALGNQGGIILEKE